jgi:hypothetical protein
MTQLLMQTLAQAADPLADPEANVSQMAGRVVAICLILALVAVVIKKLGGGKSGKGK